MSLSDSYQSKCTFLWSLVFIIYLIIIKIFKITNCFTSMYTMTIFRFGWRYILIIFNRSMRLSFIYFLFRNFFFYVCMISNSLSIYMVAWTNLILQSWSGWKRPNSFTEFDLIRIIICICIQHLCIAGYLHYTETCNNYLVKFRTGFNVYIFHYDIFVDFFSA